jgi:hypothetical protein
VTAAKRRLTSRFVGPKPARPIPDLDYGAPAVFPCGRKPVTIQTLALPHSTIRPEGIVYVPGDCRKTPADEDPTDLASVVNEVSG